MVRGSSPSAKKRFFSTSKQPDQLWGPPSLLLRVSELVVEPVLGTNFGGPISMVSIATVPTA